MSIHNRDLCMGRDVLRLSLQLVKEELCGNRTKDWDELLERMVAYVRQNFSDWRGFKGKCKAHGPVGILKKSTKDVQISRRSKYDVSRTEGLALSPARGAAARAPAHSLSLLSRYSPYINSLCPFVGLTRRATRVCCLRSDRARIERDAGDSPYAAVRAWEHG